MSTPSLPVADASAGHWTDLHLDAFVLGMLIECDDDFVSGAVLCDKLDVPRAELLKRIDSLRSRGYVIQSQGGRGYRLLGMPDGIGEREVAPLLSTAAIGRRIHHYEELASTNDEAHRLAEDGALHGEVVIAEVQTKGRGRRGRAWIAPAGKALTLSVILRPSIAASRAPEITLAAAVGVCEAARELGAETARIKWPNDVECDGRKLAGLLTELRAEQDGVRHVVLGVGLNCSLLPDDFPDELRAFATSLQMERGSPVPRSLACARLLEALDEWLTLHEVEGFPPIRERWRQLSSTLGRRVRIEFGHGSARRTPPGLVGPGGGRGGAGGGGGDPPARRGRCRRQRGAARGERAQVEGEALDLAEDGALLVRTGAEELVRVMAGDVEHCRSL